MIRIVLSALVLLCAGTGAAAQTPPDAGLEQRVVQARSTVVPQFIVGLRSSLANARASLAGLELEPDEMTKVLAIYDREEAILIETYADIFARIVARHVPEEEIRADANFDSPAWRAVMSEVQVVVINRAMRDGADMASRVLDSGCRVRQQPSAQCIALLERIAAFRAAQDSVEAEQP